MRALVTGATGFIGRRLLEQLSDPVVLTRNPRRAEIELGHCTAFAWDPMTGPPPKPAFDGVDVVFHLAGEPVADSRWTREKKMRIRDSRAVGTANLVATLADLAEKPKVLVSASAVGYYGNRGDEILDESSPPAGDFLADVCCLWEAAAQRATASGIRVVNPRIGVVLGSGGGALAKMLLPFKLGLGGRLGDGRQWTPWVHVDDVVGLLMHAAGTESVFGPMNATAPNPVSNRDFTRALAKTLHRPALFPVPSIGLELLVGEFAQIVLASQRVVPRVAETSGYRFKFPTIDEAFSDILTAKPAKAHAHGHGQAHEEAHV